MIIHRYTRITKYWLKIVTGNKCTLVNALYQDGLRNIEDTQKYSWCRSVRTLLFELGFGDVWYNQGVADIDVFIACFQQCLYDIYKQGWRSRIDESTRASFYRVYKSEFGFSHHLDVVCVKSHRVALSRLIMSSHSLRIETGKWARPPIPRQDRMCKVCHQLGDEYHFLLECLSFQELRKRLIPKYYWNRPSMYKCVDLLRSSNKTVLKNLAKFVFRCLYSNSAWFWYMMQFTARLLNNSSIRVKISCWCPPCYYWNAELCFTVFVVKFIVYVYACRGLGPKAVNKNIYLSICPSVKTRHQNLPSMRLVMVWCL